MDQTADPCQVSVIFRQFLRNFPRFFNKVARFTILQNFFQYACGGWISSNEIPDAKSRWGKFYELRDKVDLAVRSKYLLGFMLLPLRISKYQYYSYFVLYLEIIEAPKDESDAKAVGYLKDHYSACVDIGKKLQTEVSVANSSILFIELLTDTIDSIGYAPFKTIAGPENGFGGWPLVQDSWDENKFNFENATGFAR